MVNFWLVDPDWSEDAKRNLRVVGMAIEVKRGTSKVLIAKPLILAINPRANVVMRQSTWQEAIEPLKRCEIIIGGLDSVRGKDELERFCRSLLIPYIDMGMDEIGRAHV